MAFLCLYGVSLLAGCSDSGGTPSQTTLSGAVTGTYTIQQTIPDVGATYMLTGMGTVAPLGQVQVAGSFRTPGNIATGTATGQLTLTGSSGTTTLTLTGPQQAGFSPPPSAFHYTVTGTTGSGATGTNSALTNSGNITLTLVPSSTTTGSGTFTMNFGP
ncbi:MAG: hypothetical protein M3Y56_16685 [Armatimonadota bacterium]|nr:hypothetical protein [Armatimonadota bacterium]